MCGHERHHGHHGCACGCDEERKEGHGENAACGCGEQHHGRHGHAESGPGMMGAHGHERGFHRRFMTRAERIGQLEVYLRDLQAEATAVEEQLAAIKAEGA